MTPGRQLAFLWGGAALACAGAAPFAPAFASGMPACPFRALLGVPCVTCGSTRALLALARLDAVAAFGWNPLAAGAGIVFLVGGLFALGAALLGGEVNAPRPTALLRAGLAAAVAANWAFLLAVGR